MVERDDPRLAELQQGVIVLALLGQLRERRDGYALRRALADSGVPVEEGALYPLLRRLEGLGLLVSDWSAETAPPRRHYRLSDAGRRLFATCAAQLCGTWYAALSASRETPAGAAW